LARVFGGVVVAMTVRGWGKGFWAGGEAEDSAEEFAFFGVFSRGAV